MSNDFLAPLAKRLTINAAINLRAWFKEPGREDRIKPWGPGRIFTGLGKYTTLAAIGVENNMIAVGAAEKHGEFGFVRITDTGRTLAEYIHCHWEELEFRDPPKRG